jgi:CDP-glucose 4,6-dehydratase
MHVLDALSGYLLVGQRLLEGDKTVAKPWNFGPFDDNSISVLDAVKLMQTFWEAIQIEQDPIKHEHEASLLNLDCSQAFLELEWSPVWRIGQVMRETTIWYRMFIEQQKVISDSQIDKFVSDAEKQDLIWTK